MRDTLNGSDVTDMETLGDWADSVMSRPHCQSPPVCKVSAHEPDDDDRNEDSPEPPLPP